MSLGASALISLCTPSPTRVRVSECVCPSLCVSGHSRSFLAHAAPSLHLFFSLPFWFLSLPVSELSPAPFSPLCRLLSCLLPLLHLPVFPFPSLPIERPCLAPTLRRRPPALPQSRPVCGKPSPEPAGGTAGPLGGSAGVLTSGESCAHPGAFHPRFCTTSQTVITTRLGQVREHHSLGCSVIFLINTPTPLP